MHYPQPKQIQKYPERSKFEIYLDFETAVHDTFGRRYLQVICFGCTVSVSFCDLQQRNLLKSPERLLRWNTIFLSGSLLGVALVQSRSVCVCAQGGFASPCVGGAIAACRLGIQWCRHVNCLEPLCGRSFHVQGLGPKSQRPNTPTPMHWQSSNNNCGWQQRSLWAVSEGSRPPELGPQLDLLSARLFCTGCVHERWLQAKNYRTLLYVLTSQGGRGATTSPCLGVFMCEPFGCPVPSQVKFCHCLAGVSLCNRNENARFRRG